MKKLSNKWTRAAIPALLLHCSIGTVYCWSSFKGGIAEYIGSSVSSVEWAFSLAIFFLGMSAAFMGNVVEKNIHKSSLVATICFALGLAGTALFIYLKSLVGILLCYGVIMGIGLGLGYLSPVKTLMLWFKDNKGLATGLAVAGFGAAKAIATPIMESMIDGGIPFNPLEKADPDITLSAEERKIGGLGIFITKKTMDNVTYVYENNKNILTMIKKI